MLDRRFSKPMNQESYWTILQDKINAFTRGFNQALEGTIMFWDGKNLQVTADENDRRAMNYLRYNGFRPAEGA